MGGGDIVCVESVTDRAKEHNSCLLTYDLTVNTVRLFQFTFLNLPISNDENT
jgi:hypothetical protein